MSEDEIVKHTRAVYKAWRNPYTGWKKKTTEVVTEILIITFAISLSVWLHNWSDSLKDRKDEREFLTGLRGDLQGDTANLNDSRDTYENSARAFSYFITVGSGAPLAPDSAKLYNNTIFNSTDLAAHTSRYEALKGSGKFGIIRDHDLLNNIIDLHESSLERVTSLDNYYYQYQQRLSTFFFEHAVPDSSYRTFVGEEKLLRMPEFRLLLMLGQQFIVRSIIPAHDSCLVKCVLTMRQIDRALK